MYRAPLLAQFIDAQIDAAAKGAAVASPEKAETAIAPGRERTVPRKSKGTASPRGVSTVTPKKAKQQQGKKLPPTLQELQASIPAPGDLDIEEVRGARYMFG